MTLRRGYRSGALPNFAPLRRACLSIAALACVLSGCGGGESSTGTTPSGGGSPTGTTPSSGVSLTVDPVQIQARVMQTDDMPDQTVTGHATGNLAALNGKTIYVVVDDPASLFAGASQTVTSSGAFSLYLHGQKLNSPGHYTGNLRIFVSLDQAGTQQLGNSPLQVPYDVEVLSGLAVDTTQLTVNTTFGDPAPSYTVKATLSPYTTSWYARWTENGWLKTGCIGDGSYDGTIKLIDCAPDGTITITLEPQRPGIYSKTVRVQAMVAYEGTTYGFAKEIPISYTVAANEGALAVFYPPSMEVTRTRGDHLFQEDNYLLVTNAGVTSTWHPVEYLTNPLEADGNPNVNHWWFEYPYKGTSISDLPVGTYTARMRYTLTKDGVPTDVLYPITLTIVP